MATTPSGGKTSKRKTPDHNTPNTACSIEDKYRAAFEHTAAATFIFDEDTTITLANAKVTELTGYSAAEIAGKLKWIDLVAPGDAERIRLYHMPGTDPGVGSPTEYELKIYDKSGEIRDVLAHVARIPDTGSTIASWVDVTERHKNEAERIRLATAAEQSYESYTITDSHGRIQYVNTAFEQMTGLSREQVVGKRIEKIFSGQKDADIFSIMRFSVASGEVWSGRITNRDTEGKVYQTETRISPIRDAAGKILHFLSIKRDISTEVQLEEQLRQAQRLQAIGTLAGGIAHDFNNILAGIMGYTEMSLAEAPKDSDLHRKLKRVMEGCYRARDLVHQILAFSRQNKQERKPVQIELIVEEALKLLRSTLPASIKILKKIETDHSVVLADPSRIHQVLMNLCTNAFHAMKSGPGELYIQLGDIRIQEDKIPSGLDLAPGTYVKLVVSDTGCGMPPEHCAHIFEPYFSTKPPGEGSGLGLAVVHGIVKSCNGDISVTTEQGKGSTFTVYFPRIDTRVSAESLPDYQPTGGTESILLVDDDTFVLDMTTERLKEIGYVVFPFTNSVNALAFFKKAAATLDVVITDHTMPRMSGTELAGEILRHSPDTPVILCTGFSADVDREKAAAMGIVEFIYKPVVLTELAIRLRSVLDGQQKGQAS